MTFQLSAATRLKLRVDRLKPGRRKGRKCVKPGRALRTKKKCKRPVPVRTTTTAGRAGANTVSVGRLGRGSYRLTITPSGGRPLKAGFSMP